MAKDESTDCTPLYHEGSLGLHDLSNEILINIIEHVVHAKYLLSLALCSRRLCELTEPILYAEFQQTTDRSLPSFLRRLLARPNLASRTRSFTGTALHYDDDDLDISTFVEEDWTRVRAAARAASINEAQAGWWIEDAEHGYWDALAALFLSVTPNLEEIKICNWGFNSEEGETSFFDAVLGRAADLQNKAMPSPYAMSNLKDVSLIYWDTEMGMQFDSLVPFLKLKSVTTFEAFSVCEDSEDEFEIAEPSSLVFSATDLTLSHSVMSHIQMAYRFKQFRHLERLYYEHGGALVGYSSFEPPRVMAAIAHLKPCLKDLTLISDDADFMDDEFETYPIGSLAAFEKLTSIDVNSYILIGGEPEDDDEDVINSEGFSNRQRLVDSVPPTLKYLSLRDCQEHHAEQIFDLVTQKASKTPLLEQLNLHWQAIKYPNEPSPSTPTKHPGFSEEEAAGLIIACEAAGIEIVMDYLPPKPKYISWQRELTAEEKKQNASRFNSVSVSSTVSEIFHYPYKGYEECCKEHGCDPETGKQKF
jgi:hypothetical protein